MRNWSAIRSARSDAALKDALVKSDRYNSDITTTTAVTNATIAPRSLAFKDIYASVAASSSAAPYSLSLLNRVLRLMPRISAARVLLLRVCFSVS